MATAAEIQDWRDALIAARLSGLKVVEYGDKRVEYKSDREMQAAISAADRELARLTGATPIKTVLVNSSKGV